jgi:hypothetical protein
MIFQNTLIGNQTIGVGNYYQGGYIVYYNPVTKGGLIVSPTDLSGSQCAWETQPYQTISTTNTYGSGQANTTNILASSSPTPAAELCNDYVNEGYNDWFLPNQNEMLLVWDAYNSGRLNRANIRGYIDYPPGTSPTLYWTSYSQNFSTAQFVDFAKPSSYANQTGNGFRDSGPSSPGPGCWVRACRYITVR